MIDYILKFTSVEDVISFKQACGHQSYVDDDGNVILKVVSASFNFIRISDDDTYWFLLRTTEDLSDVDCLSDYSVWNSSEVDENNNTLEKPANVPNVGWL